jgi:ABC-type uncharacterized transport system auxiliary subunit
LLFAGCFGSGNVPETRHYHIAVLPPSPSSQPPLPITLAITPLDGNETYRQDRLVYRSGPYRVDTYPYDRWELSPVAMVTDALTAHLRATGLFRQVLPYQLDGGVDYVLRGRLLRFDQEDAGPGTPWTAVVEVEYEVLEPKRGIVVFSGAARAVIPVEGRQPISIVAALSQASRDAFGALAGQVAGALAAAPPRR